MSKNAKLVAVPGTAERAERLESSDELPPGEPDLGRWFWYSYKTREHESVRELVCVTELGSNYAEVTGINTAKHANCADQTCVRIHFKNWYGCTEREPDPDAVINSEVHTRQQRVAQLMGQVQEITRQLGLVNSASKALTAGTTTALARFSAEPVEQYKNALVRAKEHDLPDLFNQITCESRALGRWMEAKLIPIRAYTDGLKPAIAKVNDRIFQVELYAGLTEHVVEIKKGKPAPEHTPIHLFQRRHYMDEECLVDYRTGGMTFRSLTEFDGWICEPANLARILPSPRCVVAFRIRRNPKEQGFASLRAFIAFQFSGERDANKQTYLYIRNGEQVFRLSTAIDFGERLFPDMEHQNLSAAEQLYAHRLSHELITKGTWEDMKAREAQAEIDADQTYVRALIEHGHKIARALKEQEHYEQVELPAYRAAKLDFDAAYAAWSIKNDDWHARRNALKERTKRPTRFDPKTGTQGYWWEELGDTEPRQEQPHEPREPREPGQRHLVRTRKPEQRSFYRPRRDAVVHHSDEYLPFSHDNVRYDDIRANIQKQIDEHNRLVLVLQGLLDRSPVMMPHPATWKLNEPAGFTAALTLVYDDARALVDGPAPDFRALRDRVNSLIRPGTLTVGQEDYWERREADKENQRTANGAESCHIRFKPQGNPGPGRYARVAAVRTIGGVKHAVFRWHRKSERRASRYDRWDQKPLIACSVSVPFTAIFNADAYKPGEYRQFYNDPRTRANYLRWAPVLLLSEEWQAGNLYVGGDPCKLLTDPPLNCRGEPQPPPAPPPAAKESTADWHRRMSLERTDIGGVHPIVDFDPKFGGDTDGDEEG